MAETLDAEADRERSAREGALPLPDDRRRGRHSARWAAASCSSRSRTSSTWRSRRSRRQPHEPRRRPPGRRAPPARADPGLARERARLRPLLAGQDARPLHGDGRGGRAPLAPPLRPRLDDGRVLAPAGLDRRACGPRGGEGQAGRPHGRDPAADRPGASLGLRLQRARRADALARLRRDPGRRRHALRGDLGRLRGRAPRARPLRALEGAPGTDRGGLGRRRRGSSRCSTSTTPRTPPPRRT